ncbi:hypothetical protein Gohar_015594 [Gossypium harknessii]|uniref:Uncharacterized protein n=1 Tax=Gossypium harknessii TaxID=34285 RepID=A0A7J9G097_9ROSI|nr:hypothetical protein [Gossypium harknessii]
MANLQIDDGEEAWEVNVEEGEYGPNDGFCLVGCFLTSGAVLFQTMHYMVVNLWHPLGIVDRASWTFNNHLLVFYQIDNDENPLQVPLYFTDF